MAQTPLTFTSVGFGNGVCANKVQAVMLPHSAAGKRRIKIAKDHDAYIDMTYGRSLKCLLMMDDGQVVGCGLTTKTMLARLMTRDTPEDRKDDENGENDTIE